MKYRNKDSIRRVAALGAGVIGSGWIAAYLARGFEVAVFDPSPQAEERVRSHVKSAWPEMAALGLCTGDLPSTSLTFHESLTEVLAGADLVHESSPEDAAFKTSLLAEVDALTDPSVLIASSTSSLPITDLQARCRHPDRCVLGHPYNPVHLMPLVETGGGAKTAPEAIDIIEELYVSMGKRPIRVKKEIFGHIANRLTSAMFREAVALVAGGYATVSEIDDALRFGPALKWAIQGQFATFHTTGGQSGFEGFLQHFSPGMIRRWETMTTPDLADPALQSELVRQVQAEAAGRSVADVAAHQDRCLTDLLRYFSTVNTAEAK